MGGCAKCPNPSWRGRGAGVLGAHRLIDPKVAMQPKRNPRLTQGMGYCTSQSTLLYHALRSPLRCYPKAAAARISGADRSPLSCIKLGVAKTDALLGSRAGGIKFQSHCQMWKRVVC